MSWALVTQGRLGSLTIGTFTIPCYSWSYSSPRNIVLGQPVGNSWSTNRGEGLQSSRIQVELMCRDNANEVLNIGFWNLFQNRTWTLGQDDTNGFTVTVGSGRKTRTATNCKFESMAFRWAPGGTVGLSCVFLAPGKATLAPTQTAGAYPNPYSNSPLLMFNAVTVAGPTENTYGGSFTASNNHMPNKPDDGTKVVTNWDAGSMTASAGFKFRDYPANPFADDSSISISLAGTSGSRLFTLSDCTLNNPDDVAGVGVGQVYVDSQVLVQGTALAPPLVIS